MAVGHSFRLVLVEAKMLALDIQMNVMNAHLIILPLQLDTENFFAQTVNETLLRGQLCFVLPYLLLLHENYVCEGGCVCFCVCVCVCARACWCWC